MKRKITAITLAALVTVGLSACGQTLADVKKDATFAHAMGGPLPRPRQRDLARSGR